VVVGTEVALASSLGRRRLNQSLWWNARQVSALLWPLIVLTACAQPATVVAGTTGEGATLASFRLLGVGSTTECGGVHDRSGRCSGLCSLGGRGLSNPMCWRA
jgi:hypothetical protein